MATATGANGRFTEPSTGRYSARPRREDWRRLFTGDLTPDRLGMALRAANEGDPSSQNDIIDRALERDPHLAGVYGMRIGALTGKPWEILPYDPAKDDPADNPRAKETADYCKAALSSIPTFDAALTHLADGIGRGASASAVRWEAGARGVIPVEFIDLAHSQLAELVDEPGRLVVLTEDNSTGLPLDTLPVGEIVFHCPERLSGSPWRAAILRRALILFTLKYDAIHWWGTAVELFGIPYRIARYRVNATPQEKSEIRRFLEELGASASAMFPEGTEIELHAAPNPRAWPHIELVEWVNAELSKLMLGQTLTTEIGKTGGSYAAAEIHDKVRYELIKRDARAEAETVRGQILTPMVRSAFGLDAPVPRFERVFDLPTDTLRMSQIADSVVNKLGAEVPAGWVETELGIPLIESANRQAALKGQRAGASAAPVAGGNRQDDGQE